MTTNDAPLEAIVRHYDSVMNDLTLVLEMWIDGYPFDDDHKARQRQLIEKACVLIGKPRNMQELQEMIKE